MLDKETIDYISEHWNDADTPAPYVLGNISLLVIILLLLWVFDSTGIALLLIGVQYLILYAQIKKFN